MHCDRSLRFLRQLQKFMNDFERGHAAVRKVEFLMLDAFFLEVLAVIGFVVEADYRADCQFFEDGDVVVRREGAVLNGRNATPYLSSGLSEGELKATNF